MSERGVQRSHHRARPTLRLVAVALVLAATTSPAAAGHCRREPPPPGSGPVRAGEHAGQRYLGVSQGSTYLFADGGTRGVRIYGFVAQTPYSAPHVIYVDDSGGCLHTP